MKELTNPDRAAKGQRSTLIGVLANILLVAAKGTA
ncbi:MAG: cation-efflux pump, partial [Cytophagales bacterium]|nr:cation-efflux pump [Cytophagales bacterium]